MKLLKFVSIVILSGSFQIAIAAQTKLVNAKQNINNLENVLAEAKSKINYTQSFSDKMIPTSSFVAFPLEVPQTTSKMFANFDLTNSLATINIDSTADCHGVKSCNLGQLTFQASVDPTVYYDRDNKIATSWVTLSKKIQGFYTRGFAMADYSPANIQWRNKEILYTLKWNIEDKDAFIKMANSVVNQLGSK